ncbi:MAG: Ig-like domain-containing protein [Gammaproteobacteria bacterium]
MTNAVLESITVTSDETGPLPEGRVRQFKATGRYSDNSVRTITGEALWASSNESVATISNAQGEKGLAEAVSAGTTTITATLDGVVGNDVLNVSDAVLEALAITPANPTVPKGLQQQMTATGTFSDGSTRNVTADVTWSSLNTAVVEISNSANTEGLAFAKAQGATTIEAADPDTGIKATTGFEVSAAQLESISVSPADDAVVTPVQIPLMFGVQFKAIGAFSDGSQSPITDQVAWSTLEPGTVRIGDGTADKGYALGVAAGTTTVVAALGGKTGTATVSAVVATLSTIDVTPSQASVAVLGEQRFVATGAFSNGRTYDVTRDVTWESQDETVAVVSNDEGSEGTATGRVPGETTITATSGSVSDSATLTVTLF